MKSILHIVIACLFMMAFAINGHAQQTKAPGNSNLAAASISIPVGAFASSHLAGVGVEYSWSHHRYGDDISPRKLIGFTVHAGGTYFLGKKQTVAGNDFRFGGYTDLYLLPGIIYNPYANVNLSLAAGPALGIYKGNSNAGIGARFTANYYLHSRISIGPAVMYRKDGGVEGLWSVMVRVGYTL